MRSLSPVVISVERKLSGLTSLSGSLCIYRVPEHLRGTNEKEYTPMVVSIGPLHHGDARLLPMEEQKVRYLHDLLEKTSNMGLSGCVDLIERHLNKIREYYAVETFTGYNDAVETFTGYNDAVQTFRGYRFTEMVLLDSAFIIETFLKSNDNHVEETDRIFRRPGLLSQVVRDMKLLENQLPFFILEELYNFMMQPQSPSEFRTMTFQFFNVEPRVPIRDIKHFVDLFRTCSLPQTLRDPMEKREGKIKFRARVTELQEAGVRFEKIGKNSSSLLDIEFDNGILKIPQLKLHDDTESFFRNLVAYEHYIHYWDSYIIDYIALLDILINTPKDVEMLVDKEIIVNWLGNSEEALDVFKSLFKHCLSKHVNIVSSNFYYSSLCDQLDNFYKMPYRRYRRNYVAMLKHKYSGHPWAVKIAVISIFIAIVYLVLAFIQAITGVISVSQSGSSHG